MSATTEAGQSELRELYAASYSRLVGTVGSICGDRHEAEEAVQEAFVRLIGSWTKVARYDDPEAWLRRVALHQISNRHRKIRNSLRAARRLGPPPHVDGPTGSEIDLDRALAGLPPTQRAVLVLHRLGLDANAIARELAVPVGTVKSRLARARAALAPLLQEVNDHA